MTERLDLCDFAMRCLVVYLVAVLFIFMVSCAAISVLPLYTPSQEQEMVRVHDMRDAYWR